MKILVINEQSHYLERMIKDIAKKTDTSIKAVNSAKVAFACEKPNEYDMLVIDASDDEFVKEDKMFSEYWKSKNPACFIVGESVERRYLTDNLAKKLYDKRMIFDSLWGNHSKGLIQLINEQKQKVVA